MSYHILPNGYILDKKFSVIRGLGSGAFGVTYLVNNIHFDTMHVIKEYLPSSAIRKEDSVIPKSQADGEIFHWGLSRFYQEAKLLYDISHPNVVKVTDFFRENGTAYFVMPFLDGDTFQNWINYHPRPTTDELIGIFIPLLEGLKYIHDKGILHRDIKPENILILQDGQPILIDFGSARQAIGRKSRMITKVLTPHYAPFEQYQSGDGNTPMTPALDIYSLTACIYQSIVGDLPPMATDRFNPKDDPIIVLSNIEKFRARYPLSFLNTIDKNLSFLAVDRQQSAFEVQESLLSYFSNDDYNTEFNALNHDVKHDIYESKTGEIPVIDDDSLKCEPSYKEYASEQNNIINSQDTLEYGNTSEGHLDTHESYDKQESELQVEPVLSSSGKQSLSLASADVKVVQDQVYSDIDILSKKGRIGRVRYVLYTGALSGCFILCVTIYSIIVDYFRYDGFISLALRAPISIFIGSCIFYTIVHRVRRLHDINESGFFVLAYIIPVVSIIMELRLVFYKSKNDGNIYGVASNPCSKQEIIGYITFMLISALISALMIILYYL